MADVGLNLGVQFGKACEILVFHEDFGSLVHQFDVGLEVDAAVQSLFKRQAAVAYVVLVGSGSGVEPGVCVLLHREDVENGNIGWQEAVQFEHQILHRPLADAFVFHVEMGIEVAGMHSGVGPATTHNGNGLPQKCGECLFQRELHRR